MHYFGGKQKIAQLLSLYLESIRQGRVFVEPFCGGCSITSRMSGERLASDANEPLINLYKALQAGWLPPDTLTEDEYRTLRRAADASNPLTAFAAIGCSFSGKWWGGYARDNTGRNYCKNAKNSLLKKMATMQGVGFTCGSYLNIAPVGRLVYCDPPYENTTGYAGIPKFSHADFWAWVRETSKSNVVVVSEYNAPEDFRVVWSKDTTTDIRTKSGREARVEKLFQYIG